MASVNGMNALAPTAPMQSMVAQSRWIASFEYDATNLTLTTHLKNGSIYQHKFVVPLDWAALQTSQNHSKHWSDNIRGKKLSVRVKSAKAPKSEVGRK